MICGLCHLETDHLVKSHIIPQSIMTDGLTSGERLAIASTDDHHPKKSPTGIWSKIVCASCEKSFGVDDEYLVWFYRSINSFPSALRGEATELVGVDNAKLRRSILSVAYRAHLSNHNAFKSVDLGPYANDLREFIHKNQTTPPPAFSVAIRHITSPTGEAWLNPFHEKFNGINTYRFYFPRFTSIIRVDQRTASYPFLRIELGQTNPGYAMRFEKLSESEMRVLAKIIEKNPTGMRRALGIN